MDELAERLVTYAANIRFGDLSPAAVHAAKRSLLDSLGCAMGTVDVHAVQALARLASQASSAPAATILGSGVRTTPDRAAFVNGAMIRYRDFSDDYFGGAGDIGPHPSDNIGSLLAACEIAGGTGKDLILGLTLAYEIVGHFVDHVRLPHPGHRDWDYTILHAMASALGAGRVLGLGSSELRNALGIATVSNLSLKQTRQGELSDWKGLAGPHASTAGLFAALLAEQGISGPPEPLTGPSGLAAMLGTPLTVGELGGHSTPFRIEGTFFKYFPIRYHAQLPVWVALELRERLPLDEVEHLRVFLAARYVTVRDRSPADWDPRTHGTADHSFAYLVAAALVDGRLSEATFTPERYRDPHILDVVQRVTLHEDPDYTAAFPKTFNARIEASLRGGEVIVAHQQDPKGHPANPMSDTDLEDKFRQLTQASLDPRAADDLVDQIWCVDTLKSITPLFQHRTLNSQHTTTSTSWA